MPSTSPGRTRSRSSSTSRSSGSATCAPSRLMLRAAVPTSPPWAGRGVGAQIEGGDELVGGLAAHRVPADGAFDEMGGGLAGAEAGQTHLPAETAQRLLDRGVHLRGGGLDGELDLGAGLTLDRDGELR